MATTSRSPLSSFDAQTPEELAKLQELMKIQDDLQQAMTNRRQLFDPVLLAMAQGFLAPTKTGSFGESIANAAALVGPAQAQEEKRQLEIGQIRAELARNQLGMMQQQRESADLRTILGGPPPAKLGFTQAGPQSAEAEQSRAPPPATSTTNLGGGLRLSETSDSDLARLKLMRDPRGKELADLIIAIRKGERDDMLVLPDGTLVNARKPREVIRQGYGGTATDTFVYELGGTVPMIPYERQLYERLKEEARSQGWYNSFAEQMKNTNGDLSRIKNPNIPQSAIITPQERSAGFVPFGSAMQAGAPLAPRVDAGSGADQSGSAGPLSRGAAPPAGMVAASGRTREEQFRSQEAFKTEQEIRKAAEVERAKNEVKVEDEIYAAATAARPLIDSTNTIIKYASDPRTKSTLGQFKEAGILGGLAGLVTEGLRVGSTTIGIAGLDQAIRTAFKTPTEIRAAEILAREVGFTNLTFGKVFMQGQGAVSNYERGLVNTLGGDLGDTAEGLRAKAEMIQARAKFDIVKRDALREARSRGLSVRDLEQTEAYKNGLQTYEKELERIRDSIISIRPEGARPNRPGPPPAGSPNPAPAPAASSPAVVPPGALPPGFRPGGNR